MSIEEGFEALMKHMKQTTGREAGVRRDAPRCFRRAPES